MKDYVKPAVEFMKIKPEEWLTTDSAGGGYLVKCQGNDWAAPNNSYPVEGGCYQV